MMRGKHIESFSICIMDIYNSDDRYSVNRREYMDFTKIKLVIWDLDNTLWKGVLSDGEVELPKDNKRLVQLLVDNGIMCSVCSKNDEYSTIEQLKKFGINDFFVFKSINWSPKGDRVRQIISEMQLRAVNCMFIDDNPSNRAEVKAACNDVWVEDVDIIPQLLSYCSLLQPTDLNHKRLNQYRLLETKQSFRAKYASNVDFLNNSNITVKIENDCEKQIKRITELVQRSNQLNFTKIRSGDDEIKSIVQDKNIECGYVEVSDNFGEYGVVGFFAKKDSKLLHFVFSCRTLGMGIEQYVYKCLGKPMLNVVGEVASDVNSPDPFWINKGVNPKKEKAEIAERIILKGPCDLQQIFAYIADSKNIVSEFTFVSDSGVSIEGHNHTSQMIEAITLDNKIKNIIESKYPFSDKNMYKTEMFKHDVGFVVLSLFTDPNLGLYKDKETGALLAFGEWTTDFTLEDNEDRIISQEVFTSNYKFTHEQLLFLRENLEFLGRLTPEQVNNNIQRVFSYMSPNAQLILILGSEVPYIQNKQAAYFEREKYNKKLNSIIREFASKEKRVHIIDVNNFIKGQESFTNNINHFTRDVYFDLSQELIRTIEKNSGLSIKHYNKREAKIVSYYRRLKRKMRQVILHD